MLVDEIRWNQIGAIVILERERERESLLCSLTKCVSLRCEVTISSLPSYTTDSTVK